MNNPIKFAYILAIFVCDHSSGSLDLIHHSSGSLDLVRSLEDHTNFDKAFEALVKKERPCDGREYEACLRGYRAKVETQLRLNNKRINKNDEENSKQHNKPYSWKKAIQSFSRSGKARPASAEDTKRSALLRRLARPYSTIFQGFQRDIDQVVHYGKNEEINLRKDLWMQVREQHMHLLDIFYHIDDSNVLLRSFAWEIRNRKKTTFNRPSMHRATIILNSVKKRDHYSKAIQYWRKAKRARTMEKECREIKRRTFPTQTTKRNLLRDIRNIIYRLRSLSYFSYKTFWILNNVKRFKQLHGRFYQLKDLIETCQALLHGAKDRLILTYFTHEKCLEQIALIKEKKRRLASNGRVTNLKPSLPPDSIFTTTDRLKIPKSTILKLFVSNLPTRAYPTILPTTVHVTIASLTHDEIRKAWNYAEMLSNETERLKRLFDKKTVKTIEKKLKSLEFLYGADEYSNVRMKLNQTLQATDVKIKKIAENLGVEFVPCDYPRNMDCDVAQLHNLSTILTPVVKALRVNGSNALKRVIITHNKVQKSGKMLSEVKLKLTERIEKIIQNNSAFLKHSKLLRDSHGKLNHTLMKINTKTQKIKIKSAKAIQLAKNVMSTINKIDKKIQIPQLSPKPSSSSIGDIIDIVANITKMKTSLVDSKDLIESCNKHMKQNSDIRDKIAALKRNVELALSKIEYIRHASYITLGPYEYMKSVSLHFKSCKQTIVPLNISKLQLLTATVTSDDVQVNITVKNLKGGIITTNTIIYNTSASWHKLHYVDMGDGTVKIEIDGRTNDFSYTGFWSIYPYYSSTYITLPRGVFASAQVISNITINHKNVPMNETTIRPSCPQPPPDTTSSLPSTQQTCWP